MCAGQDGFLVLSGRVQLAQQRPAEALDSATRALATATTPLAQADAQRLQGEAHLALKDFNAALQALKNAYDIDHAAARADRIWIDLALMSQAYRGLGQQTLADDAEQRARLAREAAKPPVAAGAKPS